MGFPIGTMTSVQPSAPPFEADPIVSLAPIAVQVPQSHNENPTAIPSALLESTASTSSPSTATMQRGKKSKSKFDPAVCCYGCDCDCGDCGGGGGGGGCDC